MNPICINDLRQSSEIKKAKSIEIYDLKIFFNNICGFKSKRQNILCSKILEDNDILIFQETMIAEQFSTKYDDFSVADKLAKITHYRDSSYFSQGSMFIWNPAKVSGQQIPLPQAEGFEISAMKFSTKYDSITIISAYRSPSMLEKDGNILDFFTALVD